MKKSFLVGMSLFLLVWVSSCGVIDDAIEQAQNTDTITIMRSVGEDSTFVQKKHIRDEEMIERVRTAFEEVNWQEQSDVERSDPDYRIESYDIWIPDDTDYVEAQDIDSNAYATLNVEQSEVVIQLIIDAFH